MSEGIPAIPLKRIQSCVLKGPLLVICCLHPGILPLASNTRELSRKGAGPVV